MKTTLLHTTLIGALTTAAAVPALADTRLDNAAANKGVTISSTNGTAASSADKNAIAIGNGAKALAPGKGSIFGFPTSLPDTQAGIAIGTNALANETAVHIGNNTKAVSARRGSVTVGSNADNDGLISTVVGTGSTITTNDQGVSLFSRKIATQGMASVSVGSYNKITAEGTTAAENMEGVAVNIVGVGNQVKNSNGVTVTGVGNIVEGAFKNAQFSLSDGIKMMNGDLSGIAGKELGSVNVVGGGNTVKNTTLTSVTGVHNKVENARDVFLSGENNKITGTAANGSKEIIAMGNYHNITDSERSIVLGYANAAGTKAAVSAASNMKNTVVIGSEYKVGGTVTNGVLLGQGAELKDINNGTALGASSNVSIADGVALGSQSVANRTAISATDAYVPANASSAQRQDVQNTVTGSLGAVSVGNDNATRQIVNVAAGSRNSDAVNVAQLKAVQSQSSQSFQNLDNRLGNMDKDLRGGIAGATAIAMLQMPHRPGMKTVSVGVGGYRGATALAVGFAATNEGGNTSIKLGLGLNNRRDFNWGGSVGYSW